MLILHNSPPKDLWMILILSLLPLLASLICRSGCQSFSGSDADSGTDSDVCSENRGDDFGHYDYCRLDDGKSEILCRTRL